jgi:hypothetical protein
MNTLSTQEEVTMPLTGDFCQSSLPRPVLWLGKLMEKMHGGRWEENLSVQTQHILPSETSISCTLFQSIKNWCVWWTSICCTRALPTKIPCPLVISRLVKTWGMVTRNTCTIFHRRRFPLRVLSLPSYLDLLATHGVSRLSYNFATNGRWKWNNTTIGPYKCKRWNLHMFLPTRKDQVRVAPHDIKSSHSQRDAGSYAF